MMSTLLETFYYHWRKKKKIRRLNHQHPSTLLASWLTKLFVVTFVSLLCYASAEKNKHYHVASLCKSHFLQQLYRKIDGAVLRSQNEHNLDCLITFQTETVLQRFMLRFDQLQLDCNDHLFIYDGAHATGVYKADLSCRHTRQSVGTITTRTNFVTLKYVTDAWGTETSGFHLVVTAFKDKTEFVCRDFRCAQKDFCISTDLLCDGVNHCGDNTDETTTSLCADSDQHFKILGLNLPVFGAVAGSIGVVILCAVTAIIVVCCCRRKKPGPATTSAAASSGNNGRLVDDGNQQQKPIANLLSNDSAVKMPLPTTTTTPGGYMTLPLNKSSAVTMSGNRHPPAIDQGHFLRRVTTMGMQLLAHLSSSNSPTITRNSSAHCRGTTINNTTTVHLLNSSSFNFWCLAI
ncbi:uncharacterized protein LOC124203013 isoform X2 [Daphnia pulex]|uniref:uncharacterized protein LOC124203013 isoform X2 n=1 Tax=Daphnia pulex TaxID=6669 RepID=UPI001EDF74C5|nr:uncharacterized protein LOC124203013 isoform X2 [Daphnia pulex]